MCLGLLIKTAVSAVGKRSRSKPFSRNGVRLLSCNGDDLPSCLIVNGVLCSFRRLYGDGVVAVKCETCPIYIRAERESEEEDDRVMDEIDRIRKYGYDAVDGGSV
jgi:hypothetical protein